MKFLGETTRIPVLWARKFIRIILRYRVLDRIQVDCPIERIGSNYGGWTICPTKVNRESIVYSFGVGEDISFDLGIIDRYDLQLYAFDPTPRSIAWVKAQSLPPNLHFYDYGITDFDGTASFFPPAQVEHVSHSILRQSHNTACSIQVPVRRLSTIMRELGHTHLSILKMDIEGAEYAVIDDMLRCNITPSQILVEFHHRFENAGIRKTINVIRRLNKHAYRIFSISPNCEEYSFILRQS